MFSSDMFSSDAAEYVNADMYIYIYVYIHTYTYIYIYNIHHFISQLLFGSQSRFDQLNPLFEVYVH